MFLKSRPSAAAFVIRITLTFSPFLLSVFVIYLISPRLSGENSLSPVIITYFACLNLFFTFDFGFIDIESIGSVGGSENKGFVEAALPYRVKPNSSNARAIGTTPPSIY